MLLTCLGFTAQNLLQLEKSLTVAAQSVNLRFRVIVSLMLPDDASSEETVMIDWPDMEEYDYRHLLAIEKETMGLIFPASFE